MDEEQVVVRSLLWRLLRFRFGVVLVDDGKDRISQPAAERGGFFPFAGAQDQRLQTA